jgi:phage tail-like protein
MALIPRALSDPLKAFNFRIALIDTSTQLDAAIGAAGLVLAGFTECSGLDGTLQIEDYIEGGENTYVHKLPTRMTWGNITLKRGITLSEDLWNWHHAYVDGKVKRQDGLIALGDDQNLPVKTWIFKRGLPVKWSGPAFNASQSAVAIETLEIAHEGLELISPGVAAAKAAAAVRSLI